MRPERERGGGKSPNTALDKTDFSLTIISTVSFSNRNSQCHEHTTIIIYPIHKNAVMLECFFSFFSTENRAMLMQVSLLCQTRFIQGLLCL